MIVNKNGYIPNPRSMNPDKMPPEIAVLIEKLAENIHETWAWQKMKEGWTFGETLDRNSKEHPSLKPYSELDESQKAYDRNTASATIGFIRDGGYRIDFE